MEVQINAMRLPQSKACFGSISVNFLKLAQAFRNKNFAGILILSRKGTIFYRPDNFNIKVLEMIKEAFEEW